MLDARLLSLFSIELKIPESSTSTRAVSLFSCSASVITPPAMTWRKFSPVQPYTMAFRKPCKGTVIDCIYATESGSSIIVRASQIFVYHGLQVTCQYRKFSSCWHCVSAIAANSGRVSVIQLAFRTMDQKDGKIHTKIWILTCVQHVIRWEFSRIQRVWKEGG